MPGFFGDQADRLIRCNWHTSVNRFAEELFAMFAADKPMTTDQPLYLTRNGDAPAIQITDNNPDGPPPIKVVSDPTPQPVIDPGGHDGCCSGGGGGGGGGPALDPNYFYRQQHPTEALDWQKAQFARTQGFAENKFNTVWGALHGLMGGAFGPGGGAFTAGGQSPASPEISVGGVYSPDQVQQQVNTARAANDQQTVSRQRQFAGETAGRGFGGNSPLVAAMQANLWGQNQAANTAAETSIRQGAAQQNADQLLKTQQARESQFASRQQEDIERRKPYLQNVNAWISALAGLA